MLRPRSRALVVFTLFACCAPTRAQELCSELTRLNADAEAALTRASELVAQDRCDAYVHYSVAWAGIAKYAHEHGGRCGISAASLSDIDKHHRIAVKEREDACGGLRRAPGLSKGETFPPEIRPRW